MFTIKDLDTSEGLPAYVEDVKNLIADYLSNINIATKIKLGNSSSSSSSRSISFYPVKDNECFRSSVDNYVMLKENGKRAKKLGRNYLRSGKPTKEQFTSTINTILSILEDLEWKANVEYTINEKTHSLMTVEEGLQEDTIEALTSSIRFPLSDEETKDARKDEEAA